MTRIGSSSAVVNETAAHPNGHRRAKTDVVRLLLRKGLALTAMGAIVGAACALAAGRVLRAYPFGVASTDPVTLIGAAAVLGAVATLACWLPARTACRVDPLTALKSD